MNLFLQWSIIPAVWKLEGWESLPKKTWEQKKLARRGSRSQLASGTTVWITAEESTSSKWCPIVPASPSAILAALTLVNHLTDCSGAAHSFWKKTAFTVLSLAEQRYKMRGMRYTGINHKKSKQLCCFSVLCLAGLLSSPIVFPQPPAGSRPFCIRHSVHI